MTTNNTITLKLMVDKSRNKVVYAEGDAKFVDILLSFLILPVGTILSLTNNKLLALGSLNNLYQSVLDLDDKYFMPMASKAMLLQLRTSAEDKFRNLALQIDGYSVVYYYVCIESCFWELMSPYPNASCRCGASMTRKVKVVRERSICKEYEGVFVKGLATCMITDDWVTTPASTDVAFSLLEMYGVEQLKYFQEKEVQFGPSDVIRLLRCSLDSNTAFTDAFLAECDQSSSSEMKTKPRIVGHRTTTSSSTSAKIKLKLFVDKKDMKVIYAECDEQFVDLLFRFLTLPMGSVVKNLEGHSHITCYDNLYNSVVNLDGADCILTCSSGVLIDPMLPQHLCSLEQFIGVPAETPERFYMCRTSDCESTDLSIIPNVKCQCGVITNKRMKLNESIPGIIKSAKFIVTDDLVVTPFPSISVITLYLMKAKGGIEEIIITVGKDEALALLQAAMISKTVLTDAFVVNEEVVEQ